MTYALINQCIGFEWDAGNATKNQQKHNITRGECEEIFFNVPLLMAGDESHSQKEMRYYALGKTDNQRLVFVAFTIRHSHIRIISARTMSRKERKIYETQATDI